MKTILRNSIGMFLLLPAMSWAAPYDDAMLAFENKEYGTARALIETTARVGDPAAMTLLGRILDEGLGQPGAALPWYRKAADKGYADAQVQLAELYDAGEGVAQDIETAKSWYERAAAQNHEEALLALGQHYSEDVNHKLTAVTYYSRAAALGNAAAQYRLGLIYLGEKGVPRDDVKAWLYLSLAADRVSEAAQARDVLELNMAAEALAAARKALAGWEVSR